MFDLREDAQDPDPWNEWPLLPSGDLGPEPGEEDPYDPDPYR